LVAARPQEGAKSAATLLDNDRALVALDNASRRAGAGGADAGAPAARAR
jgi:hypothetical protein